MMHIRTTAAALTAALLSATTLSAQTLLPRDPENVHGEFENGVNYVVRRTTNPPGRFSAYLHIDAGALHETDPQNGIAHFIEHMAFNGSENYPPGELIPALNQLGMQFGADSNAHTGLDETVYKLNLPENDDAMVERAMVILGDVAHRLLFVEEEIENERSVILEEKRSRKGLQQRIGESVRARLFAGSRLVTHDVIGTEERISGFPREEFLDYWNTWYRPDLMTLIVVGDIDPKTVVAKAESQLGSFEARAEARDYRGAEMPSTEKPTGIVLSDPEVVQANVQIVRIREGGEPTETVEDFERELAEGVATAILSRRLNDLVQKGDASYLGAAAGVESMLGEISQATAYAVGDPKSWNSMLDQVLGEVQRALDHGFRERELELLRTEVMAGARRAVETEATLDAVALVERFTSAVGEGRPIISVQSRLALLEAAFERLTTDDLHETIRAAFDSRVYAYVLVMPDDDGLELPSEQDVVAAANAAWSRKTEAGGEEAAVDAILEALPEPGEVEAREFHEELGVATVRFANGVVLRHRYMDYRKGSALLLANLPGGRLQETAENRGVSEVASLASATSRLTSLQIRDLMAGVNAEANVAVGVDAVTLSIGGDPKDFEPAAQLLYAKLLDGRVEPTVFDAWKEATLRSIETGKRDLQACFGRALVGALMGPDPRFRPLEAVDVEKLTAKQGDAWLRQLVDGAAIEVAVVGDIDEATATALVARYFGSLPPASRGFASLEPLREVDIPNGPQRRTVEVETVTPQALVLAGYRGCDRDATEDRRLLLLAAQVISDRIRITIREERGLVYSMQCDSQPSQAVPGGGMFMAIAPTDPATADELAEAVFELLDAFAADGPTEAELEIAKKQATERIEQAIEQPGFWADSLVSLTNRKRTLADLEGLEKIYADFTVEQVRDAARRYFAADRLLSVIATPAMAGAERR